MSIIESTDALEACYPHPAAPAAILKEVSWLTTNHRALIEAAPFAVLATFGPGGLDCAPRGDSPGFVRVVDDKTLVLPDRRGVNRLDSLRNILADPRVALLFLIPAFGVTLRVTGRAVISADPDLLAGFGPGDAPVTALIVTVETACYQFPQPVLKAGLWNPVTWGNPEHLPSQMDMLRELSALIAQERAVERV